MTLSNAWNRAIYRAYAPVYDWLATPFEQGRQRAVERLDLEPGERVLIVGCGTGLDLEYLPEDVDVIAVDLTPAMIDQTEARSERLDREVDARVADARDLDLADDSVDAVLLHLVLSVVPEPEAVLDEAARVLGPDGRVSIYDKFVPADETPSLGRRAVNPAARALFADLNRSLEPMLESAGLVADERETFLGGVYTVTIARPA